MPEQASVSVNVVPPQAQLIEMARGHQISSMLRVAAQLKLADLLSEGPRTSEELAQSTATHAPSLYRFLRTAASLGLFTEGAAHRFALAPLGEPLRSGVPGSVRTTVLSLTGDLFGRPFSNLLYSVQTGKTAFEKEHGAPLFDWLASHPEEGAMFSDLMIGFHGPETAAVAAAYDFSGCETIADIGGATGHMLATILGSCPGAKGVVFDLPHNADGAATLIQARGMAERIRFEAGSFFESVPSGADVYMMSHIIHDWSEEQCLTILRNCRAAMGPKSRLLIIEMVIPPGDAPHPGKATDMVMLAVPGGQERTEQEYCALLAKAGFRLERVVPTESAASVVEAFLA
jgi:hypothetical protein